MAYPCGVRGKNCLKNVVACEKCDRWFHTRCEKLTKAHIKCLSSTDCDFFCTKCAEDSNGDFDFGFSLKRLEKYSAAGSLENGVKTEKVSPQKPKLKTPKRKDGFVIFGTHFHWKT